MDVQPVAGNDAKGFAGKWLSRLVRACAVAATVALICSFVWAALQTRDEWYRASQKSIRVAELIGTIGYLDEWMTMSTEMAAATGEHRWVDRFDDAAPRLNAAIAEASGLASPEIRAAMAATTIEAHGDLVTMERRVLALAAVGDGASARALINGPEFAYLKDVYASGMEIFGQELTTLARDRASALDRRSWLEAAGLGLSVVLLASAVIAGRGRKRLQKALARTAAVARTDALTELPNRRKFYEALGTALAHPGGGHYALLLIDLDRFKAVNDAYGHLAGDRVLQLAAESMRPVLRGHDLLARLGGDEFALLLRLEHQAEPSLSAEATRVAQRIVSVLAEPFGLDGGSAQVGASVGLALVEPGDTVESLAIRADTALYRAKADGRGCVRFFEPGMDAKARVRARLEGELRQAVAEDAIVPYFQPLVALDTGRLVGVEMLARWPHPERGMVPPAEFIPLAEELGVIGAMTSNLLRRACRDAAGWPACVTLACNLSPLQLRDPRLPAAISQVLEETGFPGGRLELEVTESALIGDICLARTLLDQLKKLGVRLALDDFGTGYASLMSLRALPFDKLKIDASFVGAMAYDPESSKIVSAVIGLCQSLGLTSVAEGVETEEIAGLLRQLGCDIGQGWLFGRPVPSEEIAMLADSVRGGVVQPV